MLIYNYKQIIISYLINNKWLKMISSNIHELTNKQYELVRNLPSLLQWAKEEPSITKEQQAHTAEIIQSLDELRTSTDDYLQSDSWRIWDRITGKYGKIKQLQQELPGILQQVNTIAIKYFSDNKVQKPREVPEGIKRNRHVNSIAGKVLKGDLKAALANPTNDVEEQLSKLIAWTKEQSKISSNHQRSILQLFERATRLEAEANSYLSGLCLWGRLTGQHGRMLHIQAKLPEVIKKVSQLVKIIQKKEVPEDVQAISYRKANFFGRVRQLFFKSLDTSELDVAKTVKIYHYFENTYAKLQRGENIALPRWFHATRSLDAILESKKLKQFNAFRGYGAYISEQDEHYAGFGPQTFALDHSNVRDRNASYFVVCNHPLTADNYRTWVRVEDEIPFTQETVAYIIANTDQVEETKRSLKKHNFNVPVMDRDCSNAINVFMNLITRKLPRHWRPWVSTTPPTPSDPLIFV